jgi:hypothetical protein
MIGCSEGREKGEGKMQDWKGKTLPIIPLF